MVSFNEENKKKVAKLLHYVLNQENEIPDNIKSRIINEMLWSATADLEKKDDCKYKVPIWSSEAIDHWKKGKGNKGLRHEHLYPKRLLRNDLCSLKKNNLNEKEILKLLRHYSHAAIITTNEDAVLRNNKLHKSIPVGYKNIEPIEKLFSRYVKCKIYLKFVKWDNNKPEFTDVYYLQNGIINFDFINKNPFKK